MPRPKQFDEDVVLQKAMMIFWKNGYYNTSIQELVEFVGINRASLYNSFGGKKNLFDLALEHYRKENHDGLTGFFSTQDNVRDAFRAMFAKIISDDCEDDERKGCFIANTITELLPLDKKLQKVITKHRKDTEKVFFDLMSRGMESGQIPKGKDLETIARTFYTLMTGLRVVGKTKTTFDESMETVEFALSMLD